MFSDPDYLQLQGVLLRMVRDRKLWHHPKYAAKRNEFITEDLIELENVKKLHKDAFAWYETLDKNIKRYMTAVSKLETLEQRQLPLYQNVVATTDILTPHKIKQLLIVKLVAEMDRSARQLRGILKKRGSRHADDAVRLRRRVRWLEVKLESLVKEPLIKPEVISGYYNGNSQPSLIKTSSPSHILVESPSFIISVADGESLLMDGESDDEEGNESRFINSQPINYKSFVKTPDAVEEYWSSEHHVVEHSPLDGMSGLTYHSLGVHRSDSYVKSQGETDLSGLPWLDNKKDYLDPNSEEKALERLSITVQQMMGKAYAAAMESIPLDPEEVRGIEKAKRDLNAKISLKRPNSILSKMKGQKWIEKKYRNSIHSKDALVYHPPPEPIPPKLLLSKLSDEVFPPLRTSAETEELRERATTMPPRFVNQHDLLHKTHFTLYELMFDSSKVKSKVDFRKPADLLGGRPAKVETPLAPSASVTRGATITKKWRPESPKIKTSGSPKLKVRQKLKQDDSMKPSQPRQELPPIHSAARSLVLPNRNKDRVYMTKSGWLRTRRMPSPIQFIELRLDRAKELISIALTESNTLEQRLSCLKQMSALGVTNAEMIVGLIDLIGMSSRRSELLDIRYEVVRLLLTLGFVEDAVLKEVLIFISSSNNNVLVDLLRLLRKALSSPRMAKPFGKAGMRDEVNGAPDFSGKYLNLLYVSAADSLIVHRLVQLTQCSLIDLSFYAAACLRKVKVLPPPPPLLPDSPSERQVNDGDSISLASTATGVEGDNALLAMSDEYNQKLSEYEKLLDSIDEQTAEISALTESRLRQLTKSETRISSEALYELIDGVGIIDDELIDTSYETIDKTPVGSVRAALIRMLGDAFLRLQKEDASELQTRLEVFEKQIKKRLIHDVDRKVSTECARALFRLGLYERMSEWTLRNLDNTLDYDTKMDAIRCAMGLRIRGSRITRAFVDLLELDSSEGIRIAACRALAYTATGDRRALASLRDKFEKTQGIVAKEAGKALASLTALNPLADYANSFNPEFLDAFADQVVKTTIKK